LTDIPIRKFRTTFTQGLTSPEVRLRIRENNFHLTAESVQSHASITYDLSGMTGVTYENGRYCKRDREWFADKALNN
jgi:hypothetical protein